MEPLRIGRFAVPVAGSVALHAAAAAAVLLLGHAAPPAQAPSPIPVDLAFAPSAGTAAAAPPAELAPPPPEAAAAEPPPAAPEPAPAQVAAAESPPVAPGPAHTEAPPRRVPPRAVVHQAPAAPAAAVTAEAAPAAPVAPASGPAAAGPSSAWVGALDAWIDAHLDYPEDSRRRGEQGAVLVRLTVAHDGRLLDFALLRGSGYDELDDATRAMFRNVRLPAAPLDSDPPQATLSKPVRYVLR
jgi:protein TonB